MDERRRALRKRALMAAKIAFRDHHAAIDCVVRNISTTGACLETASPVGVPEAFDLVLERDHSSYPCRVVWRSEKRIGVAFQR
jgi:hypothetical protein